MRLLKKEIAERLSNSPSRVGSRPVSRAGAISPEKHISAKKVLKDFGLLTTWDVEEDAVQRAMRRLGANSAIYKKRMCVTVTRLWHGGYANSAINQKRM